MCCYTAHMTWAGTPLFFVWNERSHRFVWWHERAHRFLWHERAHRFVWTQACSKQDCGQFFDLHAALDLIRNHFVDFCTQGQHFVEQRRVEVLQAREDILDDLDVFFEGTAPGSFSSATEMGLQGPQAGMPFHRHQCRAQKFHPACIESLLSAPTGCWDTQFVECDQVRCRLSGKIPGMLPSVLVFQVAKRQLRQQSGMPTKRALPAWHFSRRSSCLSTFETQMFCRY